MENINRCSLKGKIEMEIPERIFLQVRDEDRDENGDVTWCINRIYPTDVEYIRVTSANTVYVIVADAGGGEEHNPYPSLAAALSRCKDDIGIEIWKLPRAAYLEDVGPDLDPRRLEEHGTLVYEKWE